MKIIVCVDENYGIGKDNSIPWHISADMKHFKNTTMGHTVCMGYNTLMSLPGGKPLEGRDNIILWDQEGEIEGCRVVHSKEQLLDAVRDLPTDEVFITGGASVYKMMLPYCDEVILTMVEGVYECDTFFPNLRKLDNWKRRQVSETYEENGIKYHFEIHNNTNLIGHFL